MVSWCVRELSEHLVGWILQIQSDLPYGRSGRQRVKDHFLGQSWGSLFSQKIENLKCVGDSYFHTKCQKNLALRANFFLGILIFTQNHNFFRFRSAYFHTKSQNLQKMWRFAPNFRFGVLIFIQNSKIFRLRRASTWRVVIFARRAYFHTKIKTLKIVRYSYWGGG